VWLGEARGKFARVWAVEDDWDAANIRSNMFDGDAIKRILKPSACATFQAANAGRRAGLLAPTGWTSF
jgi:predicted NUDIX family NTP pyrophosphohydrolase